MPRMVHARLDSETERILQSLHRATGLGDSELIRKGLRALAVLQLPSVSRGIIGMGRFRSGMPDLGSNKAHLRDFGR